MADIKVTTNDLDSLGKKLDELGDVLTQSEKALLLAVFGLASTAISEATRSQAEAASLAPGVKTFSSFQDNIITISGDQMPSVSEAFRNSFSAGRAGDFRFRLPGAEVSSVSVGGETITWTN